MVQSDDEDVLEALKRDLERTDKIVRERQEVVSGLEKQGRSLKIELDDTESKIKAAGSQVGKIQAGESYKREVRKELKELGKKLELAVEDLQRAFERQALLKQELEELEER